MITNDDLLKELSLKELTELSDLKGNFEINQDIIDDAQNDALSFISSFIIIPSNPSPLLKQICTILTIIELKRKQNFPKESYEEDLKKCEAMLLKMAAKKLPTQIEDLKQTPRFKNRAFKHANAPIDWSKLNG